MTVSRSVAAPPQRTEAIVPTENEARIAALERLIEPGDCVLLKGSHSIHLGEVLHGLKVLARTNRAA